MDTRLIKLFNAALVENTPSKEMFKRVNELAAKVGYFVHPDVCNQSVIDFLHEVEINPNATFYKAWEDIISRDRIELAIDQILHYTTTYGSDFSMGNGFTRNDGDNDAPLLDFKNYKVIMPITESDLGKRCYDMLCSGIALKKETMEAVADFVIDRVDSGAMIIDVDDIKNREGQIYICNKLNIWPSNPTSLFRMIMFMTTGNTMIVNNNDTIRAIKVSKYPFDFNKLGENDLVKLSSIFLRFKNLFLAFKHNDYAYGNKSVINKLRKLAVEHHKPFKAGFWQTLFSEPKTTDEIKAHLSELTNYKKITLMQLCMERYMAPKDNLYLIRNGKQFFKVNESKDMTTKTLKDMVFYAAVVYNILKDSLIDTLKANSQKEVMVADVETEGVEPTVATIKVAKVVKVPAGMHVTMPSSEKSFIGNYPFGTSFDLTQNNLIGCYWRNAWGTNDYDLSLVDIKGRKIGWNASYYNGDRNVVYSGDMTNAEPEAAEIIKIANPAELKALIKINQFRGQSKSKFELFFGQSDEDFKYEAYENYMVNPNDIKFRATIEHENKREMQVALVGNNKITLMEVHSGYGIVSHSTTTQEDYIKTLLNKTEWFIDAAEILKAAGFQIVDETYTGEVDIDFSNLEKDSLISLMA
jgi:hypothetical protein